MMEKLESFIRILRYFWEYFERKEKFIRGYGEWRDIERRLRTYIKEGKWEEALEILEYIRDNFGRYNEYIYIRRFVEEMIEELIKGIRRRRKSRRRRKGRGRLRKKLKRAVQRLREKLGATIQSATGEKKEKVERIKELGEFAVGHLTGEIEYPEHRIRETLEELAEKVRGKAMRLGRIFRTLGSKTGRPPATLWYKIYNRVLPYYGDKSKAARITAGIIKKLARTKAGRRKIREHIRRTQSPTGTRIVRRLKRQARRLERRYSRKSLTDKEKFRKLIKKLKLVGLSNASAEAIAKKIMNSKK